MGLQKWQTITGNPYQRFRSYGIVAYDRRQRVAINYAYDFPKLKSNIARILFHKWLEIDRREHLPDGNSSQPDGNERGRSIRVIRPTTRK